MKRIERAQAAFEKAWAARDAAILDALDAEYSLRDVARVTGLSPKGVRKIGLRGGETSRCSV